MYTSHTLLELTTLSQCKTMSQCTGCGSYYIVRAIGADLQRAHYIVRKLLHKLLFWGIDRGTMIYRYRAQSILNTHVAQYRK